MIYKYFFNMLVQFEQDKLFNIRPYNVHLFYFRHPYEFLINCNSKSCCETHILDEQEMKSKYYTNGSEIFNPENAMDCTRRDSNVS